MRTKDAASKDQWGLRQFFEIITRNAIAYGENANQKSVTGRTHGGGEISLEPEKLSVLRVMWESRKIRSKSDTDAVI